VLLEKFFPPVATVLELEPEELSVPLLQYLVNQETSVSGDLNLHNFVISTDLRNYSGDKYAEIAEAMTEAWIWLERELMLAPTPGKERNWLYVTRRGKELATAGDIGKYKRGNIIPPNTLDPILASKVVHLFIRGDYDTAVFQAFKELEIRVRSASSLPQELIGTDLMRSAFHTDTGKLTDMTRPKAEREATSHLFAGAIGLFKNPSSHRDVNWDEPIGCSELIYLANHLLRMVDKHAREIQSP